MRRIIPIIPALLVFAGKVNAQQATFAVSPSLIQLKPSPNNIAQATLELSNVSSQEISLTHSILPLDFLTDGSAQLRSSSQNYDAVMNALTITEDGTPIDSITLVPGQSKRITVSIDHPQKSARDEYTMALVFTDTTSKISAPAESSSTGINYQIATNIIVSLENNESYIKPVITSLNHPQWVTGGPIHLTIQTHNPNTTAAVYSGKLSIEDIFGNTVYVDEIKPVMVLGEHDRLMPFARTDTHVLVWDRSFLFGPYHLTTRIVDDRGNTSIKSSTLFAVPVMTLLIITALLFIVIHFYLRVRKKSK